MEIIQEQPSHPLQAEANGYFYGWAQDHESDGQKGGGRITAIEFDPVTYPEQKLENALVAIDPAYESANPMVALSKLRQDIGLAMRSEDTANHLIRDLKAAPTSPEDPTPLPESIRKLLADGNSVGVIFGHQILMDIGYGISSLTCALETTEFMDRNLIVLNKAMAFEKFEGIPFTYMSRSFSNAVFVSPRTKSSIDREIPEHIHKAVNSPGARVIRDFAKKGAVYAVALHGTGLVKKSEGSYLMAATDPASGSLLKNCQYLLRFAIIKDPQDGQLKWDIGPLESLTVPALSKHELRELYRQRAGQAQLDLALQMANLLGKTVEVEESKDKLTAGRAAFRLIFPKGQKKSVSGLG